MSMRPIGADVVSVPRESYLRLLRADAMMNALRACGVAKWEGYGDAERLAKPAFGCTEPDDYQMELPL